jgi:glyoxylase-like metal-dependent hydrolase (beta-lactamase superfamily II)
MTSKTPQRVSETPASRVVLGRPQHTNAFEDSVLPVVDAGLTELVDMNHLVAGELGDGIWMEPAVGHTPGHVTIHVKGGGREAVMTGDILHHCRLAPVEL